MRRAQLDQCLTSSSCEIVTVTSHHRAIGVKKSRHKKPTMSCKFDKLN